MNYPITSSTSLLCVGMGWFPHTPGGLNRYVFELINHLANHQDCIELCGVDLPSNPSEHSIQLTNLTSSNFKFLQRLQTARLRFQHRTFTCPDAVNLHFAPYSLPLLQYLPKNVPVTFTFHGPWALESQWEGQSKCNVWFKKQIEQLVYNRCDRFIVLSKAFGQILHETYRIPWNQIHIIPGGVNTASFQCDLSRQEARAQLSWKTDRKILFAPRRLVHRMGLDKLLAAMVQVKAHVPDVWLAIAGKGPLKEPLEQQIRELGLNNHVQLLGYVPDEQLPTAYQAADLTVVPSQSLEGFGLVLLESLASGTPALCTPVGGMPEIVAPFSPELVTDAASVEAIADRLIDLLKGQISLPPRVNCRDYACNQFDWQIIAPQVRNVLLA